MSLSSEVISDFLVPDHRQPAKASNLAFNEKIKEELQQGKDICHLAFGQSPFPIPKCLVDGLKENAQCGEYLPVAGLSGLRDAIVEFHERYDHFKAKPSQVVTAPGSKEIIYLSMRLFNGDVLLVGASWTTYAPQVKLAGKKAVIVDTNFDLMWKVTVENLEKALSKSDAKNHLLVLNNPGNPSGTAYTEEELQTIANFCAANNILILSDEIYGRYNVQHCSLAKIYPEGTILTTGFSKWASAGGWRVGYALIPEALGTFGQALVSAASHTFSCAPAPMQAGLIEGLKHESELSLYMERSRKILNAVASFCVDELRSVGVRVHPSEGGFYLMPDFEVCRPGLNKRGLNTGQDMCNAMLSDARVALMAGHCFLRPETELTVRFCFVHFDGGVPMKDMEQGEDVQFDAGFVKKYAPIIASGMERLKKFVLDHSA